MKVLSKHAHGAAARLSRRDRLEYRLVWALCFVLYLVATVFRRVAGRISGRSDAFQSKPTTILSEAKSAACAAAGYAFMG